MAHPFPDFAAHGHDVPLHWAQDEGVADLYADQEDGHELGEAADGSLHAVANLQALPGLAAGGHGGTGRGLVYRPILCIVLSAVDFEGESAHELYHRGPGPAVRHALLHRFWSALRPNKTQEDHHGRLFACRGHL